MLFVPPLLCCLLFAAEVSLGITNEYKIHNVDELVAFSKSVNNRADFSGTTVYLESDLDFSGGFSEEFRPIGKDFYNYFSGTFDGQGHTISSLTMKSSEIFSGLFGLLQGTVKNAVIDSSCTFTGNFTGNDNVRLGSTIGYFFPSSEYNSITSIVNMAEVTFEGNTTGASGILYIGGIAGIVYSSQNYGLAANNCANYGPVKCTGIASGTIYAGGFAGYSYGRTSTIIYIQNFLNHGAITVTVTPKSLYIGGIAGKSEYTTFTNCVSAGTIASPTSGVKGTIVGYAYYETTITHCMWTSGVGCEDESGSGTPTMTDSSLASINAATISGLNEYASNNGWDKWLLNTNSRAITFKINNWKGYKLTPKLIILPGIEAGWRDFIGWFGDSYYNEPFSSSEITVDTTLYGRWDKYAVSFDSNGGEWITYVSKIVSHNEIYGDFPDVNKTGYTFLGWFTEGVGGEEKELGSKVEYDHTLYAQWRANNYTVTFNVNGGDDLEEPSKAVTFHSTYGTLPTPTRMGHTFLGWFNEYNESITSETTVTSPMNHALYAQWRANEYTVTFDFANGTKVEKVFYFNDDIIYPDDFVREGYMFVEWNPRPDVMPSNNLTINAQWTPKNYTATFDANGGNELTISAKVVTFDAPYGEMPTPTRTGHTFVGWFNEGNVIITSETIVSISINHTLIAQWRTNEYIITFDFANGTKVEKVFYFNDAIIYSDDLVREGYLFVEWNPKPDVMPPNNLTTTAQWKKITNNVEIIFGTKDLTEEKAKEIIKHYTDETFTIVEFEEKDEEIRAIIKFTDTEKAGEFIRSVNENRREGDAIKSIVPTEYNNPSFMNNIHPKFLIYIIMHSISL